MALDIVTQDYETFWASDYTLSKLTTEAYVRDRRFEVILCGFQINAEKPFWVPQPDIPAALRDLRLDKRAVVYHHGHFDGLITNLHYGVKPKLIFDTLGMARALHGANAGLGLGKLAPRYGLQDKGDETKYTLGKRFRDFTPEQLQRYGDYCLNDVDLTYQLALRMIPQFSKRELLIHDQVIRMFTEPCLRLDSALLDQYRQRLSAEKMVLLLRAGVQQGDLMSNDKFAQCLMDLGVDPPRKISPTTGKETWAFAKTDPGMQALQEHDDSAVQVLVEARLKNKTTIAEKGAERLIGMAMRGPATVYLKYSGASGTHRLSGGDGFNWQSMKRGSDLRNAVEAEDGELVVVADSSTIEARLLDWIAGQEDMVEVYRKQDAKTGPDMYCTIAEKVYGRKIDKILDPDERQLGKTTKLGLGFSMGADKFVLAVRAQAKETVRDENGVPILGADNKPLQKPMVITRDFAQFVVDVYRNGHPQVKKLWRRGEDALKMIAAGEIGKAVDFRGIVKTCKDGLILPNGMRILYPDLRKVKCESGPYEFEWEFWNGRTRERIFSGKVVENFIQALARIIVFDQCYDALVQAPREAAARWAHSVHDEGVFKIKAFYAPWFLDVLINEFRRPPSWAPDLPLNGEGGFNKRYGQCKK